MKLFLFTTDPKMALKAEAGGVYSLIIDWERKGKIERQSSHDLEINSDSPEDVSRLRETTSLPLTVRINALDQDTSAEIETALAVGAEIIMLPMARSTDEVSKFLSIVKGRAKTLVQIETVDLLGEIKSFSQLPWDFAYIGLNDLMLSRKGNHIWEAVTDGTVESVCSALEGRVYGFGGVTIVGGGIPIKCRSLIHEYTRLGCGMSFLRRTFKREIIDRDVVAELTAVHTFIKASSLRGEKAKKNDHDLLFHEIEKAYAKNNADVQYPRSK